MRKLYVRLRGTNPDPSCPHPTAALMLRLDQSIGDGSKVGKTLTQSAPVVSRSPALRNE